MNPQLKSKHTQLFASCMLVMACFSNSANAKPDYHTETDVARVTAVEPVYRTVKHRSPKESCWVETVREERPRHHRKSAAPAILGGIIGGVIGNEVGRGGDNKRIGSVVGAALGMSVAKDIQRKHAGKHGYDVRYRDVERCETTYVTEQKEVLQGFDVQYRYHGRDYSTFMHEHPGKKIRVAVNVTPLDQ